MEVDWAGAALDIHNSVTGEVSKAYLFVAVLPCSCFTYAEVCDDMKLENWISCHIHTYNYFGGVTRLLLSLIHISEPTRLCGGSAGCCCGKAGGIE